MDRRALGATAIVLILLMVVVATAGLDNLPRDVRAAVDAASTRVSTDRTLFQQHKAAVERAFAAEPVLFRSKEPAWRERLRSDEACLATEASLLAPVEQLARQNRRTDRGKIQDGLSKLAGSPDCAQDAAALDTEAQRWLNYKHQLPARLAAMNESHQAIAGFNMDAAATAVSKAQTDWPSKQQDLEARLAELKRQQVSAEQIWTSSADLRAKAERNDLADFDYAAFFQDAGGLEQTSRNLKDGAAAVDTLAGQLYTSWDKLLLKVEVPDAQQKVRIVKTKFPDSTLANGVTTSEEHWETIDSSRSREAARNAGMVIEHKAAGKYDSEAERVVQPPTYAYVAPPGQANSYGSWQNGIWQWLPQYLILSQLLNMSRHTIDRGDFDAWQQARRRGDIYYGPNRQYVPPDTGYRNRTYRPGLLRSALEALIIAKTMKSDSPGGSGGWYKEVPRSSGSSSGTGGGWYHERSKSSDSVGSYREAPKPSWGSSGYSGSKYQSRGTFSGSKYQSRGTFGSGSSGFGMRSYSRGSFGGGAMRSLGRGGRR